MDFKNLPEIKHRTTASIMRAILKHNIISAMSHVDHTITPQTYWNLHTYIVQLEEEVKILKEEVHSWKRKGSRRQP